MPRQRRTQTQTHTRHSVGLAPVFICPVDSCPGKTRILTGKRAWTRHRRTYHPTVDLSQYENVTRSTRSPSLTSSELPSSTFSRMEDDLPISYYTEITNQSETDSNSHTDGTSSQAPGSFKREYHPILDGMYSLSIYSHTNTIETGKPCNDPTSLPPPTMDASDSNKWSPFRDEIAFRTAEYFFQDDQTSAGKIDRLLELWAATLAQHGDTPPFSDHRDLYNVIDSISVGGIPWKSHIFTYEGERPEQDPPKWMTTEYTIWYRDPRRLFRIMLGNPEFAGRIDYAPLRQFSLSEDGDELVREYENFMSGDWVWKQAVRPCNIILLISLIC